MNFYYIFPLLPILLILPFIWQILFFLIIPFFILIPSVLSKKQFVIYVYTFTVIFFVIIGVHIYQTSRSNYEANGVDVMGGGILIFYLASYAFGIFIRLIVYSSINYIKSRKD
jgi:hypothetical protein